MNKSHNKNHLSKYELAFKYGKVELVLLFREGGKLEDPERIYATSGGGIRAEGLYEPYTVSGVIEGDIQTITSLQKAFERGGIMQASSAIHRSFTSQGRISKSVMFNNAKIVQSPAPTHENIGEDGLWRVEFSLSDVSQGAQFEALDV